MAVPSLPLGTASRAGVIRKATHYAAGTAVLVLVLSSYQHFRSFLRWHAVVPRSGREEWELGLLLALVLALLLAPICIGVLLSWHVAQTTAEETVRSLLRRRGIQSGFAWPAAAGTAPACRQSRMDPPLTPC